MKRHLPNIAGVLLGLCFLLASIPILLNLMKDPPVPEGTPIGHFMAAFMPTGYMKFVKWIELFGGLMVLIPRLRNVGLLLLGPVIVNVLAFTIFVDDPKHLANPLLIAVLVFALYLLWNAREKFARLLN